ncbi:Hypothetical protein MVR_LOCUS387 [uncultured virus]|nr:Hypothetical protein MVR_LOCUS387 [uncultured virus]
MTQVNLQKRIRAILSYLDDDDLTLTKFTTINGSNKLFDQTKKGNMVLSVRDHTAATMKHDADFIHICRVNLLYDLYSLHSYPKLTTIKFVAHFRVMLPFATTDDDKLVFPQVTTVMIDVNHNKCITDELPISKLFPNVSTLVLIFSNRIMFTIENSYQHIKHTTLVIIKNFLEAVPASFMQNLSKVLMMNDHVARLVIANENSEAVDVDMEGVAFKSPMHVCFVKLKVTNVTECDGVTVDVLEL